DARVRAVFLKSEEALEHGGIAIREKRDLTIRRGGKRAQTFCARLAGMRRLFPSLVLAAALMPAVPAAAADGSVMVGPDACAALATLGTSGAAYAPGVDAAGRAVAPADLPGGGPSFTEFPIEITVDLKS